MARQAGQRAIVSNRRAFHDYHVEERFEAGVALTGSEVKSLRDGHASLGEAYAQVKDGEVWLVGASIEPYKQAGLGGHERTRDRKLLLHRREIQEIRDGTDRKGYTLVPLRLYFKDGRVKLEIGLGRGKNVADKRQTIAERDAKREVDRALRDAAR
jgi:SsrA-binding protein